MSKQLATHVSTPHSERVQTVNIVSDHRYDAALPIHHLYLQLLWSILAGPFQVEPGSSSFWLCKKAWKWNWWILAASVSLLVLLGFQHSWEVGMVRPCMQQRQPDITQPLWRYSGNRRAQFSLCLLRQQIAVPLLQLIHVLGERRSWNRTTGMLASERMLHVYTWSLNVLEYPLMFVDRSVYFTVINNSFACKLPASFLLLSVKRYLKVTF